MNVVNSLTFSADTPQRALVIEVETMFNKNGDPPELKWKYDGEAAQKNSVTLYRKARLLRGLEVMVGVFHYVAPLAPSGRKKRIAPHYRVSIDYVPQNESRFAIYHNNAIGPTLAGAMLAFVDGRVEVGVGIDGKAGGDVVGPLPERILKRSQAFFSRALAMHFSTIANAIENGPHALHSSD